MKGPQSLGQFLAVAAALSSTAAAWGDWLPPIDALVVRADTTTTAAATETADSSTAATAATTAAKSTNAVKTTNYNTAGLNTATGTDAETATGTGTDTGTGTNTADTYGSITMVTPDTTSTATPLYKIGDTITWGWNYTGLDTTPTALDILASCSTASQTWTLTQNMSFESPGSFTWDTNAFKQTAVSNPLLTELYTLIIYDADSSVSATAEYGHLTMFDDMTFGMYTPQPYTPLSSWSCAACSAGNSNTDRNAVVFALTMGLITVMSFTWFVTGFAGAL